MTSPNPHPNPHPHPHPTPSLTLTLSLSLTLDQARGPRACFDFPDAVDFGLQPVRACAEEVPLSPALPLPLPLP